MATIVIAEDEVHIARVVSIWLKKSGHTVFEGNNGRTALELVRQHKPELLITDVNMPVMDGIELVKTCASEGLPKVGTIVLTSRCDQSEIRDQLQEFDVLLHAKPFSPSKLTADVQQLLSRAEGGVASA